MTNNIIFASKNEHAAMVNLIGNLVPLTQRQNSDIKAADWDVKKRAFSGSNWKFTQRVSRVIRWDIKKIKERTSDFARWVFDEWPEIHKM